MRHKSDLIWNNGMVWYGLIVAVGIAVVVANSDDDDGDSRSFSMDMHDLTV